MELSGDFVGLKNLAERAIEDYHSDPSHPIILLREARETLDIADSLASRIPETWELPTRDNSYLKQIGDCLDKVNEELSQIDGQAFFQQTKEPYLMAMTGSPITVDLEELLKGGTATAEVAAVHSGRCLKLGKEKFLKFVSQDFLTGLAIETALETRFNRERAG